MISVRRLTVMGLAVLGVGVFGGGLVASSASALTFARQLTGYGEPWWSSVCDAGGSGGQRDQRRRVCRGRRRQSHR